MAPARRACPVLAGSGGGAASDGERKWVKLPGSEGFRMCPRPRTGAGGGGAFFFIATPDTLVGGGIVSDRPEWFDIAGTTQYTHRLFMAPCRLQG